MNSPHRCISSNQPDAWQTLPPVTVESPFPDVVTPVSLDACIAEDIQRLWAAGIWTLGSCCGHGDVNPSVVLASHADGERALEVLSARERRWDVMAWVLTPIAQAEQR